MALALCKNAVRFDPVTAVNNVFFDEANKQIFAVRSGGATGITVKGPDDKTSHSFNLNGKGRPLISIKFSYQHRILALQWSDTTIEFTNLKHGTPDLLEFAQNCKGKSNKILTFHWISTNEIVFVTESGIEFYQVSMERKQAKLLKAYNFPVNWSIFSSESAVLLCSTSANAAVLCPFHFKNGQVMKLPKFDVDRSLSVGSDPKWKLLERDVTMVVLYGNLYIAVLRHPIAQTESGTEVNLYLLSRESPAKKVFTLITGTVGRFALNVIDSLVIVHHQSSKSSLIFDIRVPGETRNSIVYLYPIVEPLPIGPYKLQMSGFGLNAPNSEVECELYSSTWIVFQPDIIIDAALGCMWFLEVKLDTLATIFKDVSLLFDFLLLRRGSKAVILKVLKKMLTDSAGSVYEDVALVFDKLNVVYKNYTQAEHTYLQLRKQDVASGSSPSASATNAYPPHRLRVVVDQSDMYTHVLSVLARRTDVNQEYICKVVVEYARSLNDHLLPVQHYFYELIVNALLSSGKFHQLQQFIRYGLVADSRMIAGHLLSMETSYPAAYQIALDMYKRLGMSNDEIVDILLSKHKVLPALRYVKAVAMQDTVSARKFLEAAHESNDDMLFYDTYKFFEARNVRLRGRREFTLGEQCDEYVTFFEELFGDFAVPRA